MQADNQTDVPMETIRMARAIASYIENNDMDQDDDDINDYVNMDQAEEPDIFLVRDTITQQRAMCEVLAPFANTYLIVAESLFILYKNSMLESEFVKFVMNELHAKVNKRQCPYRKKSPKCDYFDWK